MAAKTYYFDHDFNARNDTKNKLLMRKFGGLGYGLYWYIVELLHENENDFISLSEQDLMVIAGDLSWREFEVSVEYLKTMLDEMSSKLDLFVKNGAEISSFRVLRNKMKMQDVSALRRKAGELGGKKSQEIQAEKRKKLKEAQEANAFPQEANAFPQEANAFPQEANAFPQEANLTKMKHIYTLPLQDTNTITEYTIHDTSKKEKEKEKEKEIPKKNEVGKLKYEVIMPFTSIEFLNCWSNWKTFKFEQHGFRYKSGLSEQAALKELTTISTGKEQIAIAVIEQSISNGWKGFFSIKNNNNGTPTFSQNGNGKQPTGSGVNSQSMYDKIDQLYSQR